MNFGHDLHLCWWYFCLHVSAQGSPANGLEFGGAATNSVVCWYGWLLDHLQPGVGTAFSLSSSCWRWELFALKPQRGNNADPIVMTWWAFLYHLLSSESLFPWLGVDQAALSNLKWLTAVWRIVWFGLWMERGVTLQRCAEWKCLRRMCQYPKWVKLNKLLLVHLLRLSRQTKCNAASLVPFNLSWQMCSSSLTIVGLLSEDVNCIASLGIYWLHGSFSTLFGNPTKRPGCRLCLWLEDGEGKLMTT